MFKEMGNALPCIGSACNWIGMCHVLASRALSDILIHMSYGCSTRVHTAVFGMMDATTTSSD